MAYYGFIGGMQSITYVVALLFLIMYIYGVAGYLFFAQNDPWHFGTLGLALVTLTRVVILDAWTQVFYINYHGCGNYTNGLYYTDRSEIEGCEDWADDDDCILGRPGAPLRCNENGWHESLPIITVIFFLSYIFIASFCVLALIIGAVGIAMFDSMAVLKVEEARRSEEKIANDIAAPGPKTRNVRKALEYLQLAMRGHRPTLQSERGITWKYIFEFITDPNRERARETFSRHLRPYKQESHTLVFLYRVICDTCGGMADDQYFGIFINICIIFVAIMSGAATVSTVRDVYGEETESTVELIVTIIFTSEAFIKIMAEKEGHYLYFKDAWNVLDFCIVVFSWGTFLPTNLVMVMRIIRLMRILKLMRALPELQNMAEAMFDGIMNVMSIGVILFIYLLIMGAIGMEWFGQNDHYRFGSIERGMITMFQCATFDAWADAMYTSAYGCEVYGYNEFACSPSDHKPQFELSVFFFTINLILGGLVMLTLFVGIMSISLEDRHEQLKATSDSEEEITWLQFHFNLTHADVNKNRRIFNFIDISNSRKIEEVELHVALRLANVNRTHHKRMWNKLKRKETDDFIDFATFLRYMMMLREEYLQRKYGIWHPVLIGDDNTSESDDDRDDGANPELTWHDTDDAYARGKVELTAAQRFKSAIGLG